MIEIERLDRINWDFPNTGTAPGSTNRLHWFPGNFIPQIPAALIQILSQPGDLVLDPFVGSGTTAVEALRLGRNAIASDRISACIMITRAKLGLLNGGLDQKQRQSLLSDLTFEYECQTAKFGNNGEGSNPELHTWFAPNTLSQLRFIWNLIEGKAGAVRDILFALFSDVLFDCASPGSAMTNTGGRRRHHWGWIADNVKPRSLVDHNAVQLFRQRLIALDSTFASRSTSANSTVIKQDARSLALADGVVDLVVTSPPYIGMIDYTHANRLLFLWTGWSIAADREHEIGARFRRMRANAMTEYRLNLLSVRDEISRVLKPRGACAIVLGGSRRFPAAATTILSDFEDLMPKVWGPTPRHPTRRRVSNRGGVDPVEFVCVFQKS